MLYNLFRLQSNRPDRGSRDRRTSGLRSSGLERLEGRELLTYMMIGSAKVLEGNSGLAMNNFTVSLNAPSTVPITVKYNTSDMTGKAGVDYDAKSGSLQFAPGQTSQTVSVPVIGNTVYQPNRTFKLTLSQAANATIIAAAGTGTILDDDAKVTPMLSIDDPRISSGTSGTKQMIFTVSLNTPVLDKTVSVTVATSNGSATAGSDYAAKRQVLTFAPGETTKQFSVTIYGDTITEGPELFFAMMSNANIGIQKANGGGWILD